MDVCGVTDGIPSVEYRRYTHRDCFVPQDSTMDSFLTICSLIVLCRFVVPGQLHDQQALQSALVPIAVQRVSNLQFSPLPVLSISMCL